MAIGREDHQNADHDLGRRDHDDRHSRHQGCDEEHQEACEGTSDVAAVLADRLTDIEGLQIQGESSPS